MVFLFHLLAISNFILSPVERIYVHLDQFQYVAGDTVYFQIYRLNDQKTDLSQNSVAYLELIDQNLEVRQKLRVKLINRVGNGSLILPVSLEPGVYSFRAYTNYMNNFSEQFFFKRQFYIHNLTKSSTIIYEWTQIKANSTGDLIKSEFKFFDLDSLPLTDKKVIISVLDDGKKLMAKEMTTSVQGLIKLNHQLKNTLTQCHIVLEFEEGESKVRREYLVQKNGTDILQLLVYPNGGKLVGGLENQVFIRSTNQFGHPEIINGALYNQNQDTVIEIKSTYPGFTRIVFTPQADQSYYILATDENGNQVKVNLPELQSGFKVKQVESKDTIKVKFQTNFENFSHNKGKSIIVKVHQQQQLLYELTGTLSSPVVEISIDKNTLKDGINQLSFYLEDQFNSFTKIWKKPVQRHPISLETDQTDYDSINKVKMVFSIKSDENGLFSFSIVEDLGQPDYQMNIDNYKHFLSWIKDPGFVNTAYLNDRKFVKWFLSCTSPDTLKDKDVELQYPIENQGQSISGRITRPGGGNINQNTFLILKDVLAITGLNRIPPTSIIPDDQGYFVIKDLQPEENFTVRLDARTTGYKSDNVMIKINKHKPPKFSNPAIYLPSFSFLRKKYQDHNKYISHFANLVLPEFEFNSDFKSIDFVKASGYGQLSVNFTINQELQVKREGGVLSFGSTMGERRIINSPSPGITQTFIYIQNEKIVGIENYYEKDYYEKTEQWDSAHGRRETYLLKTHIPIGFSSGDSLDAIMNNKISKLKNRKYWQPKLKLTKNEAERIQVFLPDYPAKHSIKIEGIDNAGNVYNKIKTIFIK
ncbi:MAG: hypothetical protein ACNS62_12325 [Candidatus Cyclobacteriaceae bacterium M3_2C_046]